MEHFKFSLFFVFCCLCTTNGFIPGSNISNFLKTTYAKLKNSNASLPDSLDQSTLKAAFEGFRKIIDDPLILKDSTLRNEIPGIIRADGIFKNVEIRNLKNFTVLNTMVSSDNLFSEHVVYIPSVVVTGYYNISCYIDYYNFLVYGNGTFRISIDGVKVKMNATLSKTSKNDVHLEGLYWDQTVNDTKFEIKNLWNDPEASTAISEIFTVAAPVAHNYFKPVIDEFVRKLMILYSEVLFRDLKFRDLISFVHAFAGESSSKNI